MKTADRVAAILFMLLAVYVYLESGKFPSLGELAEGPAFFPRLIAVALVVLSGFLLEGSYRRLPGERVEINLEDGGFFRVAVALGMGVAYIVLLPRFGFVISTMLFLVAFMRLLAMKSWPKVLLASALVVALVWGMFELALKVPLPAGIFM